MSKNTETWKTPNAGAGRRNRSLDRRQGFPARKAGRSRARDCRPPVASLRPAFFSSASSTKRSIRLCSLTERRMRSPLRTRPSEPPEALVRRHMQHDGAERGSAHARIRYSHHVLDAFGGELFRDRQIAGFRHRGRRMRARRFAAPECRPPRRRAWDRQCARQDLPTRKRRSPCPRVRIVSNRRPSV